MTNGSDMKKVAVIMAHPDDEVLGCGASIARLAGEGASVHILIMQPALHQGVRLTPRHLMR